MNLPPQMKKEEHKFVERLVTSINNFKRDFGSIITESDFQRLELWKRKLGEFEKLSIKNSHFVTCPWAFFENILGPDTCMCISVLIIDRKFEFLKHKYNLDIL